MQVIGGNIVTGDAAQALVKAGADGVKVGIGPGSICTTRVVAGVGVQCQPLPKCGGTRGKAEFRSSPMAVSVLGDSYVRHGRHCDDRRPVCRYRRIAGRSRALPGSLLQVLSRHGVCRRLVVARLFDRYFQDATEELEKLVPEGIEGRVAYKGSLIAIVHQLVGGVRAAMGYTGSSTIEEMRTTPVRADHECRDEGKLRPRRDDHQGSPELPHELSNVDEPARIVTKIRAQGYSCAQGDPRLRQPVHSADRPSVRERGVFQIHPWDGRCRSGPSSHRE